MNLINLMWMYLVVVGENIPFYYVLILFIKYLKIIIVLRLDHVIVTLGCL